MSPRVAFRGGTWDWQTCGLAALHEAESAFKRALEIAPRHFDARWSLSTVYLRGNRSPDARVLLQAEVEPFAAAGGVVGTYSNVLLGDISVKLNDGRGMAFEWGRLMATATAYEKTDHVRIEFVPGSGMPLKFEMDGQNVRSLSLDGMTFVKKPGR